ncbi:hypothetical protein DMENIID0001_144240 [Sergentomyia squamirostris]
MAGDFFVIVSLLIGVVLTHDDSDSTFGRIGSVQYPCPNVGYRRLPHTSSCDKYVQCLGEEAYVVKCARGLHFNTLEMKCMEPEQAACTVDRQPCPLYNDHKNPVYLTSNSDCNSYFLCYNNVPVSFKCAEGLHFDPFAWQCRHPDISLCDKVEVTCSLEGIEAHPHPLYCDRYVVCWHGSDFGVNCPQGHHFDIYERKCLPAELANCHIQTTTPEPTTVPTTSEEPTTVPTTSEEPTTQPTTSEEPTTQPTTSEEPTTQPTTSEEPTTQPTTSEEPTTQPTTSEEPTTQPTTSEEPTNVPTTSEEPTNVPTTSEEPSPGPTTSEEPTPGPTTSEEPTTVPTTSEEPTTQPTTSEEPTTQPTTSEEPTNVPTTSEEPTNVPTTSEEPSPGPTTSEEPTPGPTTSEEPTTVPTTSEEPTNQPTTSEEPTTQPTTSEEPTTQPTTSEEPTNVPTTSEEPTNVPTTSEEPSPGPTTSEEPTPGPTTSEEPTTVPTTSEEPTTQPTTSEEPTNVPTTSEEPTNVPTTSEEPSPRPTTSEEPTPGPTTSEEPTTVPTTSEEPTTQPTTSEEPTNVPTTSEEPTNVPTTSEDPIPEPTTSEEPTPRPTTSEEPTTVPTTSEEPAPEPTTPEEPTTTVKPSPPETTTEGQSTTPEWNVEDFKCPSQIFSQRHPHPHTCTKYILCYFGRPSVQKCAKGTIFYKALGMCLYVVLLWIFAICLQVFGIMASVQYPCPPFLPFRLPHTTSCSKFVQCIGGVATVRECDVGLSFNAVLGECTFPEFSNCVHDQQPCPLFNDPDNLVYLSDSESCESYYLCYNNQPHSFKCINGLQWDSVAHLCRRPDDANCEPSGVICPPNGTALVPSPVSCEYFYFCIDGHGYGSTCPEGTLFDIVRNFCVPAEEAVCLGPAPTTPGTTPMPTPPVSTTPAPAD